MITLNLHNIHHVRAQYGFAARNNHWVVLSFPGSSAGEVEVTLFFDADERAARAYADAINSVPAKMPIDEQVAA